MSYLVKQKRLLTYYLNFLDRCKFKFGKKFCSRKNFDEKIFVKFFYNFLCFTKLNIIILNYKICFRNEPSCSNFLRFDHELEMILPEGIENSQSSRKSQQQINESGVGRHLHRAKLYSGWSLRPIPSTRGEYLPGSVPTASIKLRKGCN